MAVQQNKKSPSRRGHRRSHGALSSPALSTDSLTGELHRRHHITKDGYYRGKKILAAVVNPLPEKPVIKRKPKDTAKKDTAKNKAAIADNKPAADIGQVAGKADKNTNTNASADAAKESAQAADANGENKTASGGG